MYDDILVPSDGSPEAERAAGHAIELADRVGATIHGLFVVNEAEPIHPGARRRRESDERSARGQRALDELQGWAEAHGVPVDTAIVEGEPATAIVERATAVGADLIVMGTHGRSGVERVLIGSVTERVVRASPVPVTTLGLDEGGQSVTSPDRARQIAREQLAMAGHAEADVEAPSRQQNSWVVPAEADGERFNVHVNSASGRAKLVRLG
jgi:nucleotide-binding universal stress UspA family protein